MSISLAITTLGKSQQWQNTVSVDSRFGYSTNSYLNPFLAEWDSSVESGYNFTSVLWQSYWHKNKNSISITAGGLYEPIFNSGENWKGGMGTVNYSHRFNSVSAGVEVGGSYFSSTYSRSIGWIQPKITWLISPFTSVRIKAGSNFRNYQDAQNRPTGSSRFDIYGMELETWPSYEWSITAGLYGSLNTFPRLQEGFNANTTVSYHFSNGANIGLNIGLQQYITEFSEETNTGGGPPGGGPPGSGPGGGQTTTTVQNTDRIAQLGSSGSLPVNEYFTLFASFQFLQLHSESSNITTSDYKVSGGVRFSFTPEFGKNADHVRPKWTIKESSQHLHLNYNTEGRLYLVGEFNNWNKAGIPLRKQDNNNYAAQLDLSPGSYEYKILQRQGDSEKWLPFAKEIYTVDDGYGSENAILLVE
ncbi:hypothetical protein [Fodinibius saliphilus]|uniref:hypothetical protein n=1 Tax=Fodinibius saliphilus TaxID=1920650 RepID=UPI001109AD11|nr:hypothetical protein [Fodinibius saliphilus]